MADSLFSKHDGGAGTVYLPFLAAEEIGDGYAIAFRSASGVKKGYLADATDVPAGINISGTVAADASGSALQLSKGKSFRGRYSGAAANDFCVCAAGVWGPNGGTGSTTYVVEGTPNVIAQALMISVLDSVNGVAEFVAL